MWIIIFRKFNNNKVILSNKLIISPDSLYKIKYPLKKFDFIWIDEGVSFMYYLGKSFIC